MRALVTGGGGFLGGAIARMLRERGDEVRSFQRSRSAELDALGVEQRLGDIADAAAVASAAQGVDAVFHVAAKAGVWGPLEEFRRANVDGTRHVLEACRASGVPRLVHTSSPSVVFDGTDMEGVDESVPYAEQHHAHYPETKAEAERMVLAANGPSLATVALRPHLIWGPRDAHLVPRILSRGRRGQLRRIGRENKLIDSVYIDNAAEAHLLAGDLLAPGAPCAGRAYFITNGEPMPVWDLVNAILRAGKAPPVTRTVPVWAARAAGTVLESVYGALGLSGEPRMTRFVARELSTAHWFRIDAARRDLGYVPRVSIAEGLERLAAWLAACEQPSR